MSTTSFPSVCSATCCNKDSNFSTHKMNSSPGKSNHREMDCGAKNPNSEGITGMDISSDDSVLSTYFPGNLNSIGNTNGDFGSGGINLHHQPTLPFHSEPFSRQGLNPPSPFHDGLLSPPKNDTDLIPPSSSEVSGVLSDHTTPPPSLHNISSQSPAGSNLSQHWSFHSLTSNQSPPISQQSPPHNGNNSGSDDDVDMEPDANWYPDLDNYLNPSLYLCAPDEEMKQSDCLRLDSVNAAISHGLRDYTALIRNSQPLRSNMNDYLRKTYAGVKNLKCAMESLCTDIESFTLQNKKDFDDISASIQVEDKTFAESFKNILDLRRPTQEVEHLRRKLVDMKAERRKGRAERKKQGKQEHLRKAVSELKTELEEKNHELKKLQKAIQSTSKLSARQASSPGPSPKKKNAEKCPECQKSFTNLRKHLGCIHGFVSKPCPLCPEEQQTKFFSKAKFISHWSNYHKGQPPEMGLFDK